MHREQHHITDAPYHQTIHPIILCGQTQQAIALLIIN